MTPTHCKGKAFMPRGKTADAQVKVLVQKFAKMVIGHSFFIAGVARQDVEFIRRPALRMGCGIRIAEVEEDEIYLVPGVRIWREEGSYDEL